MSRVRRKTVRTTARSAASKRSTWQIGLVDRLLAVHETRHNPTRRAADVARVIPVDAYRSDERLARERERIFGRAPLVVGHVSDFARGDDAIAISCGDLPVLLVRDDTHRVRAFLNTCRHRGARVVPERQREGGLCLVCPYHGWTYDLRGRLVHAPGGRTAPSPTRREDLVSLPVSEAHGLIWLSPRADASFDLARFLGPLATDLEDLDLGRLRVHRRVTMHARANWKLVVEAFLESDHIAHLHRSTLGPLFLADVTASDRFGLHLRSAVARRALPRAAHSPRSAWIPREMFSLSYYVFPNTIMIVAPGSISLLSVWPKNVDETVCTHAFLVARRGKAGEDRKWRDESFRFLDEEVFRAEDLAVVEGIQAGLAAEPDRVFRLGPSERQVAAFHEILDRELARRPR